LHLKPGDRISYELQGDAVVIRPQLGAMSVCGALKLFGAGKLDFVDCYLAAASIREGRTLVSFDRALAKLHGTTVMKPGDRVK
jgi:predicted nucleic acid-binding protein